MQTMTPMPPYRRTQTLRQMSLALLTFAVLSLALESGGLLDWANRLELGPERTIAIPVCNAVHRLFAPLHIEQQRHRILVGLAELGWSDDPALLASVSPTAPPEAEMVTIAALPSGASSPSVAEAPPAHPTAAPPLAVSLDEPPLQSKLPLPADAIPSTHSVIALTGDSMMAVGLSAAIQRDAPRYKNLSFLNLFKSGTGLARPEVFNWQLQYPAMLHENQPNFVIVAIGANDAQGFEENRIVYPFGSAEWCRIYAARVDAFLRMLTAHGATVVWVALPPMKDPSFAARVDLVNRIQYNIVSASPHAIWFSSATLIGDDHGAFRDFGQISNKPARLRATDGIHISDEGAELLSAKILPWLASQPLVKQSAPALTAEKSLAPQ